MSKYGECKCGDSLTFWEQEFKLEHCASCRISHDKIERQCASALQEIAMLLGAEGSAANILAAVTGLEAQNTNLVELFNAGYALGHHDTVESQYTDIHEDDAQTYHKEVVDGLLKELKEND